jgi:hypothetical protein
MCSTANDPREMSEWVINCRANSQEALFDVGYFPPNTPPPE